MTEQRDGSANIRELEALDRAKRSLLECRASLLLAVAEGYSEVQRMRNFLAEELPARLKSERRVLQRRFDEAKADLVRAELVRDGSAAKLRDVILRRQNDCWIAIKHAIKP